MSAVRLPAYPEPVECPAPESVRRTAYGAPRQQTSSRSRHSRVSGLSATQPSSSPRTSPAGRRDPALALRDPQRHRPCGGPAARGGPARCGRAGPGARRRPRRSASGSPSRHGTAAARRTTSPRRRSRRRTRAAPARPGRPRWRPPGAPPRSGRERAPTARSRRRPGRTARPPWSARRAGRRRAARPRPSGARRRAAGSTAPRSGPGRAGGPRPPRPRPRARAARRRCPAPCRWARRGRRVRWPLPGTRSPYACQARRASGQSWRAVAAMPTFHQSGAPDSRSSRATARRPAARACSQSCRNLCSSARLNQDSESQGSRSAARVSSAPASSYRPSPISVNARSVACRQEAEGRCRTLPKILTIPACRSVESAGLSPPGPTDPLFASNHVRSDGRSLPMGYPAARGRASRPASAHRTRASASTTSGS